MTALLLMPCLVMDYSPAAAGLEPQRLGPPASRSPRWAEQAVVPAYATAAFCPGYCPAVHRGLNRRECELGLPNFGSESSRLFFRPDGELDALNYSSSLHKNDKRLAELRKRLDPRQRAVVELLQAGVDRSVIALWLGHGSPETTQIYLDAHLALKEQALAKTTQPHAKFSRFRPDDKLLLFLQNL